MLVPNLTRSQVATADGSKLLAAMPIFLKLDSLVIQEKAKYAQEYYKKKLKSQLLADEFLKKRKKNSNDKNLATLELLVLESQNEVLLFEKEAIDKLASFELQLQQPYIEQINKAIAVVAKKLNYMQVIDIKMVSLLYMDPTADITDEIILEIMSQS